MKESVKKTAGVRLATPRQMKAYLDRFVVGQDEAKKALCVAVYNHYKRLCCDMAGGAPIGKSNMLMIGETGSGKTYMVKTLARMLDVPVHVQDCTKITASGYVGSDVEDCIVGLLRESGYDIAKAQMGIVILDEVDKIAAKSAGPSVVRDVSGECVQQSLLKIIEGDKVGCPPEGGRKHPEQPLIWVDTTNILFIGAGAFVGLEDIITKRIGTDQKRIGFSGAQVHEPDGAPACALAHVTPQDLRTFGMIPEFIGRMPVVTHVEKLTREDLVRILTEPEDSITGQYRQLLGMDGVGLEFTPEALDAVAEAASTMGTGARGLRGILETVMMDIMFEAPDMRKPRSGEKKVTVTEETVRSRMKCFIQKAA